MAKFYLDTRRWKSKLMGTMGDKNAASEQKMDLSWFKHYPEEANEFLQVTETLAQCVSDFAGTTSVND
jgi:hypothetical protein